MHMDFNSLYSHTCQTPWSVFQDGMMKDILFPFSIKVGESFTTLTKRETLKYIHVCKKDTFFHRFHFNNFRYFSLSFQSSFHLSLTVLVYYRFLISI